MTAQTNSTQKLFNILAALLLLAFAIMITTFMVYIGTRLSDLFMPLQAEAKVVVLEITPVPIQVRPFQTNIPTIAPTQVPPSPMPTASPTPLPTPALPYLIAGDGGVNVRMGPGTGYEKIALLLPGTQVTPIGWSGAWWQITYQDEVAFVFGDIVTAYNVQGLPEVVPPPLPTATPVPTATPIPEPLPAEAIEEKRWIDIDLSEQRLTAYENQTPVQSYLVSTGLPQTPTPVGQYRIWIKLKTDDMSGADYYIEDVPWVMYFYRGYGLHGVTWHANFGHQMSHGCVNQPNDMAEWLFNFAEVGTLVNIHE